MVRMIAPVEWLLSKSYMLPFFVFVCVHIFVFVCLFARAHFIIGFWGDE
jgi:hypothetical protein